MKERLTGAIILVALIVLLVPELLRGPVRPTPHAAAPTAAGEPPLRSYTIDLADEAHARSSPPAAGGPQPPQPLASAAAPASAAAAVGTAQEPQPGPAPAPAAAPGASAAVAAPASPAAAAPSPAAAPSGGSAAQSGGAWLVQLGSFANRANAEHLARQVRAQGFQVSVSQGSSGRRLYRVRVGPAHDRAAAAALAERLRALGHSGSLVPK